MMSMIEDTKQPTTPESKKPEAAAGSVTMLDKIEIQFLRDAVRGLKGLIELWFINDPDKSTDAPQYAGDSIRERVAEYERTIMLLEELQSEAAQRAVNEFSKLLALCGIYDIFKQTHFRDYCSVSLRGGGGMSRIFPGKRILAKPATTGPVVTQAAGPRGCFEDLHKRTMALKRRIGSFADDLEKATEELEHAAPPKSKARKKKPVQKALEKVLDEHKDLEGKPKELTNKVNEKLKSWGYKPTTEEVVKNALTRIRKTRNEGERRKK
jgi:hypothetical protein